MPDRAPYRQSIEEVVTGLATNVTNGLTEEAASERRRRYGRNEIAGATAVPAWRKFLAQFQDVLVLLLLVATGISVALWAYERSTALPYEAIAIFAVVLLNATMGYIQESRAEAAVAALRAMSAADATVVRDGRRQNIPAADVVPGDIILIEEGDTVPADGRIAESTALQTAEASLTGESLPVTKDVAPLLDDATLGDRHNMVFSGTAVTYGHGVAVVTATGMQTEMGQIASLLDKPGDESTPLQRQLDRTGRHLGLAVMIIAVVMVATIIVVEDVSGLGAILDVLILGVA